MKKTTLIFSSLLLLSLPFLNQVNAYPIAQASPVAPDPTPVSTTSPIAVPNPSPPPVTDFVVTKANLTSALTQSRSLVGYLILDQQRNSLTTLALNTELGFAGSIGYDLSTASNQLSGGASAALLSQINAALSSDKTITSLLNGDRANHGQPYHHDINTEINTANQLMNQILSALNDLTILSILPSPIPTPVSVPLTSPSPTKAPTTASPVTARTPNPNPSTPSPTLSQTSGNSGQTAQQKLDYLRTNGPAGLLAIQKTIDVRQNTIAYINGLTNIPKDDRNALDTQLNGEIQTLNELANRIRADKTMADLQKDEETYFYKWANLSDTTTSLDQSYQLVNVYAASSEISAIANFDSIFTGLQNVLNDLSKSYSKNDSAHLKIINDLENQLKSTKSLVDQQNKVATSVIDTLAFLYVKKSNHLFFSTYNYVSTGTFKGDASTIINNEGNILKGINTQFLSSKNTVHNIVVQVEQQISLLFDGKTFASEVMNPSAIWYVAPNNGFALSFIKPAGYGYQISNNVPTNKNKAISTCILISATAIQNYQCVADGPLLISNPKQYLIEIDKVISPSNLGSTNGSKTIQIGYDVGLILPDYYSSNSTTSNKISQVLYTSSVNTESFIIKMIANGQVTSTDWNSDKAAFTDFLGNFIVVK